MLDACGLHTLIWKLADQAINDILVASPMDAESAIATEQILAKL